MSRPTSIHLPVFQRFDCHACTFCCRDSVVNVSAAERERIIVAGWADRIPQPLFIRYRFRGRRLYCLSHQPDGACVFLGEDQRCRLHAETGVETKPLACRLFPFVPTPGVDGIRLDLRGDCPSVAANKGRSLSVHRNVLAALAEETATGPMPSPPDWLGGRAISGEEFGAAVVSFERILRSGGLSLRARLRAGSRLLDMLTTVRIKKVRGRRFKELLDMLADTAIAETEAEWEAPSPSPSKAGGPHDSPGGEPRPPERADRLFRQWLFLHGIKDHSAELAAGLMSRLRRSWRRYGQSRRFVRHAGEVPRLGPDWPVLDFESVMCVRRGDDKTLEPVVRSLRLKLDAHAFAGPGYYGYDLLSGLTALWLLPAVAGWFARLQAAAAGHEALTADDVLAGLRRAHHTFGVSPVFGRLSERLRLRALARPGVPPALLAVYGP